MEFKHLRILQLTKMSSRLVGLDHLCKCSLDVSLALWPVWASYSWAKKEVYIVKYQENTNGQEVHVEASGCVFPWQHQLHQAATLLLEWLTLSYERDIGLFLLFFFCHIFPLSHTFVNILLCKGKCMSEIICVFQAALFSSLFSFGVCLAFIHWLLTLYPHCIWSCVHFNALRLKGCLCFELPAT